MRLPSGPAGIRTTTGNFSALARPTPYQLSHRVACGRRGTHGIGWRAWTNLVARMTPGTLQYCRLYFQWQASHNLTSIVVLRGRHGTHGTGWRAWTGLVARVTPGTPRHFAWQAWHNLTPTVVLRGRRGTTSHPPSPQHPRSFCVAGTVVLRGRCGTHGTGWLSSRTFKTHYWKKLTCGVIRSFD